MQLPLIYSAGLLLLALLAASPALDSIARFMWGDRRRMAFTWRGFWADQEGVVAITYLYPTGNNSSTPPTAVQASQNIGQSGQVFFADTDTQAVIVHNWGLPASAPFFLFPFIWLAKALGGASDSSFATNFTFGFTNTNSITINKLSIGTGSGGTYDFWLRKSPFTT